MSFGSRTGKRVANTLASIERLNGLATDAWGGGGAQSVGNVLDGLANGIATGFGPGEAITPEISTATQVPQRLVAASAGTNLATPVAYWFMRWPMRVRVGSTNANAVPATSGLLPYVTQATNSRGVLRLGLADINAAAHIILDQGGLVPITTAKDFQVHIDIANVTNRDILATSGYADIGLFGGAIDVDPTAVANAAAFFVRITAGKIYLYSTATTSTLIGTTTCPSGSFVLSFMYDSTLRRITAAVDGVPFGQNLGYTIPTSVTGLEVGARVVHLAAYTAASHAPLGVDLDGLLVNQFCSPL